jgi:hypothetical protein
VYHDRVRRWIAFLLVAWAAPAAADSVALATTDPSFHRALSDALATTGMTVVIASDAAPPALAELTAGSRALADREHATATVWLVPAESGSTLVAYDRGVDRVLVRELPYRVPLTTTQAAEAARMTRTMLRALRVMPQSEPPPKEVVTPPPQGPDVVVPVEPPAEAMFAATLALDLHVPAPGSDATPVAAVAVTYRPERFGVMVSAELAPTSNLTAAAFTGDVRDTTFAAVVRAPLRVEPKIVVAAEAGLALHLIHLRGVLVDGEPVDTTGVDPAIRLGATAGYAVRANLLIGFGISADTLIVRQVYDAGMDHVLEVPRLQIVGGISAALQIR